MAENVFALKGDILYSLAAGGLCVRQNSYLVCEKGCVAGIFKELPERYQGVKVRGREGALVIPGMTDLHTHAPQYAFRGLGMDMELLDWLQKRAFPEEAKYANVSYAALAYAQFVKALKKGASTRAVIFATAHTQATLELMRQLEESGLNTMVGRVNMDRNAAPAIQERNAAASLSETRAWLDAAKERFVRTAPILTPRFIPSCSNLLLKGLGGLQKQRGLPVQSHLSETQAEVAWVKNLHPDTETYAGAYLKFGLLGGGGCPTVMAHCVYSGAKELELLKKQGVWVAHCPLSNAGLGSGVAPMRAVLSGGLKAGLGSDVAGGHQLSLFGVMAGAVKDSKLRWRLQDQSLAPLTFTEAFYLATRGGGGFFGQVGAFEDGWAFDALVLNDENLECPFALRPQERLERLIYLGGDGNIAEKYVEGRKII